MITHVMKLLLKYIQPLSSWFVGFFYFCNGKDTEVRDRRQLVESMGLSPTHNSHPSVAQKKSWEMLALISPSSELSSEPLLSDLESSMLESPLPQLPSYFKRNFFPFMSNTCRFTSRDWLFRLLRRRRFVSKRMLYLKVKCFLWASLWIFYPAVELCNNHRRLCSC